MKNLLIAVLLFPLSFLFSQNKVNGFVLDRETSNPLEAATIGAKYKPYGCYSDKTGMFNLTYLDENDSLKISYVGYGNYNTTVKDIIEDSVVLLDIKPISIGEVYVTNYKSKPKKLALGFFKGKSKSVYVGPNKFNVTNVVEEIAYPTDGGKVLIQSINTVFRPKAKNFPIVMKLILKDENGMPGEEIYISEIIDFIDAEPDKYKKIKIDVSDKHILMPKEGVYVAAEYLINNPINVLTDEYGPSMGVKPSNSSFVTWVRTYNRDRWVYAPRPVHLSIGLTVLNYKN